MRRRTTAQARQARRLVVGIEPLEGRQLLATALGQGEVPTPPTLTEFPIPSQGFYPTSITTGPDGNLWFLGNSSPSGKGTIGRITPGGVIEEFPLPFAFHPGRGRQLAAGPDGALWFSGIDAAIGRITTDGVVTKFSIPGHGIMTSLFTGLDDGAIAAGADGNLWFTDDQTNKIGRITPGGTITEFSIPSSITLHYAPDPEQILTYTRSTSGPSAIAAGPDGDLWFTEVQTNKIGRITPDGTITEYPLGGFRGQLGEIFARPDGDVYFTASDTTSYAPTPGVIGKITPDGVVSAFRPPSAPGLVYSLAAGPDGDVYFTESGPSGGNQAPGRIGRITPAGDIFEDLIAAPGDQPRAITGGPDGNLWFTQYPRGNQGSSIFRVNLVVTPPEPPVPLPEPEPIPVPPDAPPPFEPPPEIIPPGPPAFVSPFSTTPGLHAAAGRFAPFSLATRSSTGRGPSPFAWGRHRLAFFPPHLPRLHLRPRG